MPEARVLRSSVYTYEGREFRLLDPDPDDVSLIDVAFSLSRQCRFNGHTKLFYSVAQHSTQTGDVLFEWTKSPEVALVGMLHDAAEAYTGDVPRPIKRMFDDLFPGVFSEIELGIERAIYEHFGLLGRSAGDWNLVKLVDDIMVSTEIRDLMSVPEWREDLEDPLPERIVPEPPDVARERFVRSFLGRWLDAGRSMRDL